MVKIQKVGNNKLKVYFDDNEAFYIAMLIAFGNVSNYVTSYNIKRGYIELEFLSGSGYRDRAYEFIKDMVTF